MPEKRVSVPIASIAEMVISEYAQILMVWPYSSDQPYRRKAHDEARR